MLLKLLIYTSFSLLLVLKGWFSGFTTKPAKPFYAKPITANLLITPYCKNRKKPQWVVDKVLYLAAVSGYGAGRVAELFNQRYGHNGDSVGKTFVYYQMKEKQYQIRILRRDIKKQSAQSRAG